MLWGGKCCSGEWKLEVALGRQSCSGAVRKNCEVKKNSYFLIAIFFANLNFKDMNIFFVNEWLSSLEMR
ncbi:MAG: hypothetical protein KBC30_06420 [Planctomycetes bacterium]|nr:hypothetical protein [Planctomycetota bacterium]HQA99812.1 hypothetical protein [Planctomycetota bacterium]